MWTTCSFNRLKWYFFYKTSCDTKPLAFHQSSLCSSTVGLSLWLENLRSSRSCTSQDFKHLLWIPTRTWTGSLTFLFFLFSFFFIYRFTVTPPKVRSHVQHWYTKTPLFILFFPNRIECATCHLPHLLSFQYCQNATGCQRRGGTPASSEQLTCTQVILPAMRFKALHWGTGCLDVSRAPPLSEDTHRYVTVWFHGWTYEIETERASERSCRGVVPCCLLTTLLLKKRAKTKRKPTSNACLLLSWVDALKMHSHSSFSFKLAVNSLNMVCNVFTLYM